MGTRAIGNLPAAASRKREGKGNRQAPDLATLYREWIQFHDGVVSALDLFGVSAPIARAQMAWLLHPQELAERGSPSCRPCWCSCGGTPCVAAWGWKAPARSSRTWMIRASAIRCGRSRQAGMCSSSGISRSPITCRTCCSTPPACRRRNVGARRCLSSRAYRNCCSPRAPIGVSISHGITVHRGASSPPTRSMKGSS